MVYLVIQNEREVDMVKSILGKGFDASRRRCSKIMDCKLLPNLRKISPFHSAIKSTPYKIYQHTNQNRLKVALNNLDVKRGAGE